MKESKIFDVYESGKGRKRSIYTLNLVRGKDVYGEKLFREGKDEYREWETKRSKLAAAIMKGVTNIHLRKGDYVLYLGAASGTTPSHVSDIVGADGLVFAVEFSPVSARDLVFLAKERKNLVPILEDANHTREIAQRVSGVDYLYQDLAQPNQTDIFLKSCDAFLKPKGFAFLAVKARSIDIRMKPRKIFQQAKKQIEKHMTIVDYRELDPYEKDHCIFICKKR